MLIALFIFGWLPLPADEFELPYPSWSSPSISSRMRSKPMSWRTVGGFFFAVGFFDRPNTRLLVF